MNTIAIPCSSHASIDSVSLIDPPGWTIALIPFFAASSTQSLNGKNASDARTVPSTACSNACIVAHILFVCPVPIPFAIPSLTTTIALDTFKDKATQDLFIGKKVGDVVTVNTKGLFEDDHQLMDYLKVGHDNVHDLAVDVDFTIEAINASEPAELNQELFDKLFGEGNVATLEELKAKIKEDAEAQFAQQADQKLLADVQNFLIDNTKFDLPAEFLKKWLQTVGEKKLSPAEAEVEYARSEKGLRFQLIEGKAMAQSNIQITFEDLKTFTTNAIKQQMAQFGQTNPSDEEVQGIVARVLSNQEEVRRLSDQVVAAKLLELFKEKANPTTKEVTYEEFIAASYGE